ncbi:uncharacterized protein PHACADRAFT_133695 [Phanerochaete carnosa HHB-10118-sp]|uniref:Transcriptional regulatory protein RXT2 N-terminal domain-containing protein n=1 Tax=Phanerochaete carnosa (strain HHB-10118-sp) TaxID=650164 RepID=K5XCY5_PHACS|nr:uncharacterized protein PHACADRAFT_133695 [Phanerochaete carnosa HHB-10118-sp]EKM60852.1 hypothetical protein PHACADRAFT_133695 [Phanerochaete carnosa HHB-10118-sp]
MKYEDPSYVSLPSNDAMPWYYPSHGTDFENEDNTANYTAVAGNWGRKRVGDARWVRKGKMAAWGPNYEEWEIEDQARKRLKILLPTEPDPDAPITLPHLRSPTPPLTSPYPAPNTQHLTYTSFVLDKGVTQAFRSKMLDELEESTNSIIEQEGILRRALGRLWQALSEDPDTPAGDADVIPKREDEDVEGDSERERRLARAPNLEPITHKLFLTRFSVDANNNFDPPSVEVQTENMEKSLSLLRDFQDDGREYVERLEEIRDGIGDLRKQRDAIWDIVRRKAISELRETVASSVHPPA